MEKKLRESYTKYNCDLCNQCFHVKHDFETHIITKHSHHGPTSQNQQKLINPFYDGQPDGGMVTKSVIATCTDDARSVIDILNELDTLLDMVPEGKFAEMTTNVKEKDDTKSLVVEENDGDDTVAKTSDIEDGKGATLFSGNGGTAKGPGRKIRTRMTSTPYQLMGIRGTGTPDHKIGTRVTGTPGYKMLIKDAGFPGYKNWTEGVTGTPVVVQDDNEVTQVLDLPAHRQLSDDRMRLRLGRSRLSRKGMVRAKRCGYCVACIRANCGVCSRCQDMVKYGGNGTRKQACMKRVCKNKMYARTFV